MSKVMRGKYAISRSLTIQTYETKEEAVEAAQNDVCRRREGSYVVELLAFVKPAAEVHEVIVDDATRLNEDDDDPEED